MRIIPFVLLIVMIMVGGGLSAEAAALRIAPRIANAEQASATLIAAQEGWYAGGVHHFALELTHTAGWHTYWKNPGDSGLPTQLQVDIPASFSISALSWPAPERLPVSHLVNYGYQDTIRLYFSITAPNPLPPLDRPIQIKATWLACQDICIPEDATFVLPAKIFESPIVPDAAFMETREIDLTYPTLKGHFFVENQTLNIILPNAPRRVENAYLFLDHQGVLAPSSPQVHAQNGTTLVITAPLEEGKTSAPPALSGFVTLDKTPYKVSLAVGPNEHPIYKHRFADIGLLQALLFAFLGGVILNIMPCVFPILSLKALSMATLQGKDAREARLDGIIYAAGIITGFVVIAGLMAGLRQAGMAIGWGFQLQEPWFVTTLIIVLFLVVLSLRNALPLNLNISVSHHQGYRGAFLTGLLATVLASPCTAPFMAPAIGFAITLPSFLLVLVFAVLGLGLAFPYLLISTIPALHRLLPKPGPWMQHFKDFLAYPLLATILWLLWVLGQQAGLAAVMLALLGLLFMSLLLWIIERSHHKRIMQGALWILALLVIILTPLGAYKIDTGQSIPAVHQPFSLETLNQLRKDNRPVFVYATADWCITCKVNEGTTLNRQNIKDFFAANDITVLRADWTRRDDTITRYLETLNRSGVPVYVFYPTNNRNAVLLPQILTPSGLIQTLEPLLKNSNCGMQSC